ncbi:MAG: hypothetical protein F6K18_04005 [Okeania sp. SIO2C2]|uniref:hypothetical protein n=1 Tax=Okeania sp. SIO2C2 TaxID=2607787 RepID=UPI0013BA0C32|nr:hypothetical protein [Okeania sp. SIO2C2]NEP86047.1 hypothetical protein [Okeania sp. SIO2C2]
MQVRWKILLVKITVWLSLEIWLNLVGLDYLADYSEFIFEQNDGLKRVAQQSFHRDKSSSNP